MGWANLKEYLNYQLPIFDDYLSAQDIPLRQRPHRAVFMLVEYCVKSVSNDKDWRTNYFEKPWFKWMNEEIRLWYKERYATALEERQDDKAPGIVLIYNTPFSIAIPMTLFRPEEDKKAAWFTIPNEILPGEKVLDWLTSPPNLKIMRTEEIGKVEDDISKIATATRRIRANLMTVPCEDKYMQSLVQSIPIHIYKGVADILKGETARRGLAVWELHLAVEKALKLIILQQGTTPNNTHDLKQLSEIIIKSHENKINLSAIDNLPTHRDAIKARYGQGKTWSWSNLVQNYQNTLYLLADLTKALKREFVFNNTSFLIRSPY